MIGQAGRGMAIFWLVLIAAVSPFTAAVCLPLIVWAAIKSLRVRKQHQKLRANLRHEVAMARYAKRMKAWS